MFYFVNYYVLNIRVIIVQKCGTIVIIVCEEETIGIETLPTG
ncbi:unnamed protein product [marine sediment metagenome]|uniref:Uncharacterized protein n=1 Tax=marine sediment metagenome TaxID=412755 RepID=X1A7U3_9ZZZZ